MAWDKTPDTAWTPIATFEDMKDLNRLAATKVQASAKVERNAVRVKLRNPSDQLAFQVRLSVLGGTKAGEILPVLWDDNYISLMPGETREVEAHYMPPTQLPAAPVLRVEGWNVEPVNIALQGIKKASGHE
jgi:exo-1,4-beta-D-glucosaminidase